jgi:hypothetical protein
MRAIAITRHFNCSRLLRAELMIGVAKTHSMSPRLTHGTKNPEMTPPGSVPAYAATY